MSSRNLADQWSTQFQSMKRSIISKRSTGIPLSSDDVLSYGTSLDRLHAQLRTMSTSLVEYGISASELSRREVLLENLRVMMLKGVHSTAASASASASASFATNVSGGSFSTHSINSQPGTAYNPVEISNKGLSVQREQVLKQQDAILGQINVGVDRLFHQAVNIGEEASVHSRLLDSLDDNVEVTQRALKEEAKHAEVIREKTRFFYLYLCIAFEVIVIVLLCVLWAMHSK